MFFPKNLKFGLFVFFLVFFSKLKPIFLKNPFLRTVLTASQPLVKYFCSAVNHKTYTLSSKTVSKSD